MEAPQLCNKTITPLLPCNVDVQNYTVDHEHGILFLHVTSGEHNERITSMVQIRRRKSILLTRFYVAPLRLDCSPRSLLDVVCSCAANRGRKKHANATVLSGLSKANARCNNQRARIQPRACNTVTGTRDCSKIIANERSVIARCSQILLTGDTLTASVLHLHRYVYTLAELETVGFWSMAIVNLSRGISSTVVQMHFCNFREIQFPGARASTPLLFMQCNHIISARNLRSWSSNRILRWNKMGFRICYDRVPGTTREYTCFSKGIHVYSMVEKDLSTGSALNRSVTLVPSRLLHPRCQV